MDGFGGIFKRLLGGGGGDQQQSGFNQNAALQFVQDKWNDLKNAYVVYHQSIWQSLLFYANQSWIDWDDARKVWQPQQPTDEWVPRPRINRFSPTMDAVASNFANLPEVEAIPKQEDDPQAHVIAEVCSDLVEYAVTKEGLKQQQDEEEDKVGLAAQLFVLEGMVFTHLRVNKKSLGSKPKMQVGEGVGLTCQSCDKYQAVPADGDIPEFCQSCGNPLTREDGQELSQPELDDAGNPVQEEQSEYEISCEIGNALFAFPRAGSTSVKDSPFYLWAQRRTLDDIWFRWKFEAQADSIWPDGYSVTYEHALNFWYTGYSSSTLQIKDSCMVLECYVPPEKVKDFPQGFYGVAINDKPAFFEEWDFPAHPLTAAKYLALPTLPFGRAVSFDCVEIQRETNAYESVIKLHGMVTASDPWVVDANTIVSDISGRADKIIKWRKISPDSEPPHRAGHGSLDDGIYKQREELKTEFQNISMAVNAFRGQQEGGVNAAAAIQQLRSQAELMFSKPMNNWRNLWRETLRKYVLYMQHYYSFEQLAKILGDDRTEEIRAFMQADLDDVVDWVASDHGLPRTKDELRQEMMVMFDKGALDVNDPSVQQKIYQLFGETGMKTAFNKNATNARLENQAFRTGTDPTGQQYIPPEIHPMPIIEDLAVHLYFHKDQALSQDFKKWPPEAQQALIEHTMETEQELQMMMQPMQPAGAGMHPQIDPGAVQGQNPALPQTPTPQAPPA